MAAQRERAEWEEALLQSGLDPAEVDKRREQVEGLYRAAERAMDEIERERTFTTLLLEGMPPDEASERAPIDDSGSSAFREFRDEVRRSFKHLGLHLPERTAKSAGKQKRGGRNRKRKGKG